MLNLELGSPQQVDGRSCLVTAPGIRGHAVYGPYEALEPGEYFVSFTIARADDAFVKPKTLLAVIDISCNAGNELLTRREILNRDLGSEPSILAVRFTVPHSCRAEYRVWVSGKASLLIEDNRVSIAVDGDEIRVEDGLFPDAAGAFIPFFVENRAALLGLYRRGFIVRIEQDGVQLVTNGIALNVRSADDLNFIGELFLENAYNLRVDRPLCVVDIGMNIGLASLHFASKDEVKEVHAFEPFPETLARALTNMALNPTLAAKIESYGLGLSDHDFDGLIAVDTHGDSGAMTTVGVPGGVAVNLSIRDAAATLTPIIANAEARGLDVVLKVDCEGSEFAIFGSLERAGLLGRIRAFMVEWHTMFDEKGQETLTAPLRNAGFLVFDRSPPIGNGFFYAVRIG